VPLPDAPSRRRLLDLYARGLTLGITSFEPFIARTEGASAAFIRELLRKAALFAAGDGDASVEDRHLDEAIRELVMEGGELTRSLLGYRAGAAGGAGAGPP
jgi:ATP-dependent 26S proteasome regulatory subunit